MINKPYNWIVNTFFIKKYDVVVLLILCTIGIFYFFTFTALLLFIIIVFIYTIFRVDDIKIEFTLILLFLVTTVLAFIVSYTFSSKGLVKDTITVYKDVIFVENGHKMITNYSDKNNIKIVNLSELTWYKLKEPGCVPTKRVKVFIKYKDIKLTNTTFQCQSKIKEI